MQRTSLIVVAALVIGCSSSDSTSSSPTDSGTTVVDSGSSGTVDSGNGGADAGSDATSGPDPKTACATLSAEVTTTQTKITLSAANKHPFADAPAPTGGAIVEGTYRLTSFDQYNDGAGTTLGEIQGTMVLMGGLWEIASKTGNGMSSNDDEGGGSYTVSEGKVFWKNGCGIITAGPSTGGVTPLQGPYTATPTTIAFIVNNGANVITKTVYTKDP